MGDRLGTAGVVGFFSFFLPPWPQFHFLLSTSDILFFSNLLGVFAHILHTKSHCCKAATAYDHITLSTPVLIWSLKLSRVKPAQYFDGWPPGNSRCCRLLFFFSSTKISVSLSSFHIWHPFLSNSTVFTHTLHTKSHCCKAATAYDHTTLSTPVLVWSLKLSSVEPAQYFDGWPPGNSRCCRLLFFFSHHDPSFTFFFPHLTFFFFSNLLGVFTHILHTKSHCCKAATAYDHITLTTPVLVWSLKLSRVKPAQYLDGWPPGNSRCCRLLFLFSSTKISVSLSSFHIWHPLVCVQLIGSVHT